MPTPTIPDGELYFNATTYTGNGTAGRVITVPSINNVGFAWVKLRSGSDDHRLANTVTGGNRHLQSNNTGAESTGTNVIQAFSSNTFTVGSDNSVNLNGSTYVGWTWADGGAAVTNTAGSISAQVSANPTAGFSVVTYTGNGTSSQTCGHGLGVTPSMVIWKNRNDVDAWIVYHNALTTSEYLVLNTTAAKATFSGLFTGISSTVLPLNNASAAINANGYNYVAYCWAPIAGYSAFGSYTGNGSADGPFVYTGFRPRFIMIKNTSAVGSWEIQDTSRAPSNVMNAVLQANTSSAEITAGRLDSLSNGFKLRSASDDLNTSGSTYIYMAFCENPLKYANAR